MTFGNLKTPFRIRGFTTVELLVGLAIISVLGSLVTWGLRSALERAHEVKNMANLRTLGGAIHSFAADRNGYLWTREEIGFSSFRERDDPLGLPFLLRDYAHNPSVWWNPAGRPALKEYGNNYAWSRSANVTSTPLYSGTSKPAKTVVVWDNHTMTLPSVHGVNEPPSGGPRAAPAMYRRWPHRNGTALGWLYLDGHVEIR